MAEGLARAILAEECPGRLLDWEVGSAGISAWDEETPTEEAISVMGDRGIDISGYRSRRMSPGMIDSSDLVLVMEGRQLEHIRRLCPGGDNAFLLLVMKEIAEIAYRRNGEKDLGLGSPEARLSYLKRLAGVAVSNRAMDREYAEYEVSDPIGSPGSVYEEVASLMEGALRVILRWLCGPGGTRDQRS